MQALYDVEKKTFVDIVLKDTQTYVLQKSIAWAQSELFGNEHIKKAAVEDGQTQREREHL